MPTDERFSESRAGSADGLSEGRDDSAKAGLSIARGDDATGPVWSVRAGFGEGALCGLVVGVWLAIARVSIARATCVSAESEGLACGAAVETAPAAGFELRETEALAARGTALSDCVVVRVGLGLSAAMLEGLGRTGVGVREGFGAGVSEAAMVGAAFADCWRATDCGLTVTGVDSLGVVTCDEGAALAEGALAVATFEGPG